MVGLILPLAGSLAPTSTGGGPAGIQSVDTYTDLAGITASPGAQRYVVDEAEVRTLIDVDGEMWVRDRFIRKADGTLYTQALGLDVDGNKLDIYGGMTVPGTWPTIGTYTVNSDHVVFNGVVYPDSAVTAERYLLWLDMYEAPPSSVTGAGLAGLLGGNVRGGTSRITGIRFTDGSVTPQPLDIGHYSATQALAGGATWGAGYAVECLVDLSGADEVTELACGRGPGVVTKRSSILTGTRFFECGAINGSAAGINGFKVRRACLITLT
jgi:hypothetical protein